MRLDRGLLLVAAAAAAALSAGGHHGHAKSIDPPFEIHRGDGGRASAPAPHDNGHDGWRGDGGKVATTNDAVLELIAFVRAREWGLEVDVEGSGDGRAKFVVTAGTRAAGEGAHEGNWGVNDEAVLPATALRCRPLSELP